MPDINGVRLLGRSTGVAANRNVAEAETMGGSMRLRHAAD
jgi:hypothetical protein